MAFVTIWSASPAIISSGGGYSLRSTIKGLSGGGGTWNRIRVTISYPATSPAVDIYRWSIGVVGGATPPSCTGPIIQLTSAGGTQTVNIPTTGGTVTSDIASLSFTNSDTLLINFDMLSAGGGGNSHSAVSGKGDSWYFLQSGGPGTIPPNFDYNNAAGSSPYSSSGTDYVYMVSQIEADLVGGAAAGSRRSLVGVGI